VVARSPENTGTNAGSGDGATGNGDGKLDSDLSMVSIVNVYPTRTSRYSPDYSSHDERATSGSNWRDSNAALP
jgi:hypothetical protein